MHLYNNPSFFHVKKELGNLIKSQHLYIKVDDTSNFANIILMICVVTINMETAGWDREEKRTLQLHVAVLVLVIADIYVVHFTY